MQENPISMSISRLEHSLDVDAFSFGMLMDALDPFSPQVCEETRDIYPDFRAVICPHCADIPESMNSAPLGCPSEKTIRIVASKDLRRGENAGQDGLVIAIADVDDAAPSPAKDRIVLTTPKQPVFVFLTLQEAIAEHEEQMRTLRTRIAHEPLIDVFALFERIVPHPLFLADRSGNVIARSPLAAKAKDDLDRKIIHSAMQAALLQTTQAGDSAKHGIILEVAAKESTLAQLVLAIQHRHSLLGVLCVACPPDQLTEGIEDRFGQLAALIQPLCVERLSSQANVNIAQISLFDRLLDGQQVDRISINKELANLDIEPRSAFKLLKVDSMRGLDPTKTSLLALSFISYKGGGDSLCFLYNGTLAVLQHSETNQELSHQSTDQLLSDFSISRFDVLFGVSDVFFDIADILHAFHEAEMALSFKKLIDTERCAHHAKTSAQNAYYFYEAYPFFLLEPEPKDRTFLHFTEGTSFLPSLLEEDLQRGTNDFDLLWNYLLNERNATESAKQMYVHRNTVLYRIDRIQKKYRIDLGDHWIREKICSDYRTYHLRRLRNSSDARPA